MKVYGIIVESENPKLRIPLMVSRAIDDLRFAYKDAKTQVEALGMTAKIGTLDIKPQKQYVIASLSEVKTDEWEEYNVEFDDIENKDFE